MEKYIEQNGITYELRGEQYYPLLELPEQKEVGKYGRLYLEYHRCTKHDTDTTVKPFNGISFAGKTFQTNEEK